MDLEEYAREGHSRYKSLAATVASILQVVVQSMPNVRLQQIQHRSKATASLRKKLLDRGVPEGAELGTQIKDLAGCRLVFYTNADVDQFWNSGVMRANFDIDWDRTKFHYPEGPDPSEGFFISYNYVVKLKDDRAALPEYAALAGLWCEVQVQTTLEHAWSEMAHDTLYKPEVIGFGTAALERISGRMNSIMKKHLLPAGFDFQKVADEVARLRKGHEIHLSDPLGRLSAASDNNERAAILSDFNEYVLPLYDALKDEAPGIRAAVIETVHTARETEPVPIPYPGGEVPGHTSLHVVAAAMDVIDRLRFVSPEALGDTFEALLAVYPGAVDDDDRKRIISSAQEFAQNRLEVWRVAGATVQEAIIARIAALSDADIQPVRAMLICMLDAALSPQVEGSTSDYRTFTIQHMPVKPSDALRALRRGALAQLERLLDTATNDADRLVAIRALQAADDLPHSGDTRADLFEMVLGDTVSLWRLLRGRAGALSVELRRVLEHDAMWAFRRRVPLPPEWAANATMKALSDALASELLALRDELNADQDYVTHKTLIGYDSVFAHQWDRDRHDIKDDDRRRSAAVDALVARVSGANWADWERIIARCAAVSSNDGGTFPSFHGFLAKLGQAKPALAIRLLTDMRNEIEPFLSSVLLGLEDGPEETAMRLFLDTWIAAGERLQAVAFYCERSQKFDRAMFERCANAAIARDDDAAVASVVHATVRQLKVNPQLLQATFFPAIRHLAAKGDHGWVQGSLFWFKEEIQPLITEAELDELLDILVSIPKVGSELEEALRAVAKSAPVKVIDYFGRRVAFERHPGDRYDAVPHSFHRVHEPLQSVPAEVVARNRSWYDPDQVGFAYLGGSFISRVFPHAAAIVPHLAPLAAGSEADRDYLLEVLQRYEGDPAIHDICKDLVDIIDAEDKRRLSNLEIVIDATGVMVGDFGPVDALNAKRAAMKSWLDDPRPKVRSFAESHIRQLENSIAADQRRSSQDLEFRKRYYGDNQDGDEAAS